MNELVNDCRFIGNIGQDPELKYLPSGTAVLNFSIAVNMLKQNRDGEDGGYTRDVVWVDLSALGAKAETLARLATKGTKIAVSAAYSKRSYKDKDDNNRIAHNFTVRSFQLLGGRPAGGQEEEAEGGEDAGEEFPF